MNQYFRVASSEEIKEEIERNAKKWGCDDVEKSNPFFFPFFTIRDNFYLSTYQLL
jgi:hypothetical protein